MSKEAMPEWYRNARGIADQNLSVRAAAGALDVSPSSVCKWVQAASVVDDLGLSAADAEAHGMARLAAVYKLPTKLRRKALRALARTPGAFAAAVRELGGGNPSNGGRKPDPAGVAGRLEARAKALRATLRGRRTK